MRPIHRVCVIAVALACAVGAGLVAEAPAQSRRAASDGTSRRYSPFDRPSASAYDRREPANYAASRRSWDPYTPYYNRPAVWPYYPRYYGSWYYGPYAYRYGYSPWFAPSGPYRWPHAWRIAEVGPVSFDRLDYGWRVPFAPYGPSALISATDVGRGIPAVLTAEPATECYYW